MNLKKSIESMVHGMQQAGLEPGAIVCDPTTRAKLASELEITDFVPGGVQYLGLDIVVLYHHEALLFVTSSSAAKNLTTKTEVQRTMAAAFSRLLGVI